MFATEVTRHAGDAAAGAAEPPPGAAFFDVDETLIGVKSMFRFLGHYLRLRGESQQVYERLTGQLRREAAAGVPREHVNRSYYRLFAGQPVERLARAGRDWYRWEQREAAADGGLFLAGPVDELRRHQRRGDVVHLLSGSFFACLDPLAEALGADAALGTRPVVRRGELTGEVLRPMIGAAKGRALALAVGLRGYDGARCHAYGDHASDLPMLAAAGSATVVGDDPVLGEEARRRGWRVLPGLPAAARTAL
ncbi:HAD family hydrolase [Allostreptomyces psammosilenae]|uniref:HAD superfamily hydrolase (TIGR01490 family) n=1 Tax=Allostreptomyces psammosilenae TaxID=1892865 RepID=A0A853AD51_9ACTN|nr:HAD-IB family hydrolase [Allostreptomyces psammosilenae]NYI08262.1 HAD superfamily hydrolase (TIGR01490 family) [Allostreptomyces psammosilenae]